jgi:hypothetical protein
MSSKVEPRSRRRKFSTVLKSVENLRPLGLSISVDVTCCSPSLEQPTGKFLPRHAALSKRPSMRLCEISPEGRAKKRLRREVDEDLCAIAAKIQLSSIPFSEADPLPFLSDLHACE